MKFIIYFTLVTATGLMTSVGAPPPHAVALSSMQACNDHAETLKKKVAVPKGYTLIHVCKEMAS